MSHWGQMVQNSFIMRFYGVFVIGLICMASAMADQIAFVRATEQEDQQVCVLDVETGALTQVGPGKRDGRPVWSPDGSLLAFDTQTESGMGICVARPDGSELRYVSSTSGWRRGPRWSADGKMLAYTVHGESALDVRVGVCDIESGTEQIWPKNGETPMLHPVWMPGMRLLYALRPGQDVQWDAGTAEGLEWLQTGGVLLAIGIRQAGGKPTTDLYVVTSENAAPLPEWVMPSPGNYTEWAAEPSPDGWCIAWESDDGGDREVFVLNKKGAFDLSNDRSSDWNPCWSPDAEWVAFESFRSGRRGIYRAYVGTARVSPVAVTPGADNWSPSWAPDGRRIAFVSDRTGNPEIYVANAKGRDVRQLTGNGNLNFAPAWRPTEDAE